MNLLVNRLAISTCLWINSAQAGQLKKLGRVICTSRQKYKHPLTSISGCFSYQIGVKINLLFFEYLPN